MLSAVKNFFLTFLISILVFAFVAIPIAELVITNLGDFNGDGEQTIDPSQDGNSNNNNPSGGIVFGNSGSSINLLLIGTDFRPSTFVNYDPEQLKALYGIEPSPIPPAQIPNDLAPPANLSVNSDGHIGASDYYVTEDGSLIFEDGFYEVPYRKINSDTIILIRIDKERGHTSFTTVPTDAYVSIDGVYVKIGELYGKYGLQFLIDRVHAMTGIAIDNYIVASYEQFPGLVDALMPTGVSVTVPYNISYNYGDKDVSGNLSAGRYLLNGASALQLLYYDGYTDGVNTRASTSLKYVRELFSQYTNITNYASASKTIVSIVDRCDTDLTKQQLVESVDMIFKCASLQIEINIPTTVQKVGSKVLTVIADEMAIKAFSNYRKIYN